MWYFNTGLILACATCVVGLPTLWFTFTREANVDYSQIAQGLFGLVFVSLLTVFAWPLILFVYGIFFFQWLVSRERKRRGLETDVDPYARLSNRY